MIERIHIERLQVQAHVGVSENERTRAQRIALNLTVVPHPKEHRDELGETTDYSAVGRVAKGIVNRRQYKLIETLAEEVAEELLARFSLRRVEIEVRKFVLADAEYVSVTAVREREPL